MRVAELSYLLARELKKPGLDPETVRRVGLAHDVGYLEIDDTLLRKKGKLTERQFEVIKTHTKSGLHLFEHVDLPEIFSDGLQYHHEHMDGSGYPEGLKGGKIPPIARLIAVANVFDAVTSERPHRPALSVESALEMIQKEAGKTLDKSMVEVFLRLSKNRGLNRDRKNRQ